jgi:DNA gyrase subunit B
VEGDSAGGCFSGDTKVALADGRDLSFEAPVQEAGEGKEHFCYTILPDGSIGLERIVSPRKTRSQANVVEVILDNGERIICTPDHRFMMRDGSFQRADKLCGGDSLMPLYRQTSRIGRRITIEGYELVFDPTKSRWIFTHLLADDHNLRHQIYAASGPAHRHHLDFDKRNNNPTNVRRLSKEEHLAAHRQHAAKTLGRAEVLEKLRAIRQTEAYRNRIRKTMLEPAMRESLKQRAKQQWQDEAYKQRMLASFLAFYKNSPEYQARTKAILQQAQQAYWADASHRAQQSERTRRFFQEHPDARQARVEAAQVQWKDTELLRWRSAKTSAQWTEAFRLQRREAYDQTYLRHSLRALAAVRHLSDPAVAYETCRRAKRNNNLLKYSTLRERYFGGDDARMLEAAAHHNHQVVCVRALPDRRDVYDLEVPGTHNFALATGVFVHNSAKQGRDRRFQAILPIKGKILNVEKARLEKVLTNEEIRTLITALGCGIGSEFNLEKLRYHKAVIMTDADVDGSHIRTLLLTFFYRQMHQLVVNGHIYIAQPPLYKIKRGKREEYIETDAQMSHMLLDLGSEGVTLTHLRTKRAFKDKSLLDLLKVLAEVDPLLRGIMRAKIDPASYVQQMDPKRGLPLYMVRLNGTDQFLFDDEELSKLAEKHDLNLEELEKASHGSKTQFTELFQSEELGELAKRLEKHDLTLQEYYPQDSKIAFKLEGEDGPAKSFGGLQDVLLAVQEEGRKGMTIQRYKGLGEMNPTQLWETTMDPAKRTVLKVTLEDAVEAEKMFTTLMGEQVEPRKQFIEDHALEVKELDI